MLGGERLLVPTRNAACPLITSRTRLGPGALAGLLSVLLLLGVMGETRGSCSRRGRLGLPETIRPRAPWPPKEPTEGVPCDRVRIPFSLIVTPLLTEVLESDVDVLVEDRETLRTRRSDREVPRSLGRSSGRPTLPTPKVKVKTDPLLPLLSTGCRMLSVDRWSLSLPCFCCAMAKKRVYQTCTLCVRSVRTPEHGNLLYHGPPTHDSD